MGITAPITPGGLFPLCPAPAEADFLDASFWTKGNRPSFGLTHGKDPEPPGLAILAGYYEKGYAESYSSMAEAELRHGTLIISPLGTLSKFKPDGSLKHRIIQDLRTGGSNLLASMLERIVLPRPSDHGWELYSLWKSWRKAYFHQTAAYGALLLTSRTRSCPRERGATSNGSLQLRWKRRIPPQVATSTSGRR